VLMRYRPVKRTGVFRVGAVGLLGAVSFAQQHDSLGAQVEAAVNHAVGWHSYWESPQPSPPASGAELEVKAVLFPTYWLLFVPSAELLITLLATPESTLQPLLSVDQSRLWSGSGQAAFEKYRRTYLTASDGCFATMRVDPPPGSSPRSASGRTLPAARACPPSPSPEPFTELDLRIKIRPSPAGLTATGAADPLDAAGLVRSWVTVYFPASTGRMVLPEYSPLDPRLYVYLDIQAEESGILIVDRDPDGQFVAGKLVTRLESVAYYRSRIEQRRGLETHW
jgi:hypothetical protein